MEDPAISRFDVLPDYRSGFMFHWSVRGGFNDPSPWRFTVMRAFSQGGEWIPASPVIEDAMAWKSDGPIRVNKSDSLFFKLVLDTSSGHYETDARTPYGDLDRSEFLLAREIMRREVLHMSKMAGVECRVWSRADYGPRCPHCLDPITGHPRDNHCRFCFGTGFFPAYRGPFDAWCLFSENSQHQMSEAQSGDGMSESKRFTVRMVNCVPMKKNDIIHDSRTAKRYYVNQAQSVAELRRVMLVQSLSVSEIAVTDPAYTVGEGR